MALQSLSAMTIGSVKDPKSRFVKTNIGNWDPKKNVQFPIRAESYIIM